MYKIYYCLLSNHFQVKNQEKTGLTVHRNIHAVNTQLPFLAGPAYMDAYKGHPDALAPKTDPRFMRYPCSIGG